MGAPVMLSYGMGVDSTCVLVHGLEAGLLDPGNLVVATAMTGDEYELTGDLVTDHVLPILAGLDVRYVQLARAGQDDEAGFDVLSDSTRSTEMVMEGNWRLSDELTDSGTVPSIVPNRRFCSWRAKGQVLDWWTAQHFAGAAYRHIVGYNADEPGRARKDTSYTRNARDPWFPLLEWPNPYQRGRAGWDRQTCERYLLERFGVVEWPRSCCGYCPYQAGLSRAAMVQKWRREPEKARQALELEFTAVAINPRSLLFGRRSARQIAIEHGMGALVDEVDVDLQRRQWAIYDVRRAYPARKIDRKGPSVPANWDASRKGQGIRYLRTVDTGTAAEVKRTLVACGGRVGDDDKGHGHVRLRFHRPTPPYPTREHFLVAAPVGALDKVGNGFHTVWAAATPGGRP